MKLAFNTLSLEPIKLEQVKALGIKHLELAPTKFGVPWYKYEKLNIRDISNLIDSLSFTEFKIISLVSLFYQTNISIDSPKEFIDHLEGLSLFNKPLVLGSPSILNPPGTDVFLNRRKLIHILSRLKPSTQSLIYLEPNAGSSVSCLEDALEVNNFVPNLNLLYDTNGPLKLDGDKNYCSSFLMQDSTLFDWEKSSPPEFLSFERFSCSQKYLSQWVNVHGSSTI